MPQTKQGDSESIHRLSHAFILKCWVECCDKWFVLV